MKKRGPTFIGATDVRTVRIEPTSAFGIQRMNCAMFSTFSTYHVLRAASQRARGSGVVLFLVWHFQIRSHLFLTSSTNTCRLVGLYPMGKTPPNQTMTFG